MSLQINKPQELILLLFSLVVLAYVFGGLTMALDTKEKEQQCYQLGGEYKELNNDVYICVDKEGRVL